MAAGTHSQGALSKILIEPGPATHTYDAGSYPLEYLSTTLAVHGRHGGDRGIRGTLQHESSRIRTLQPWIHGAINMYVSPNDWNFILEDMLGWTESGPADTWTSNDTLPYFGILMDTDYDTWEFKNCMVDHWILRGRAAPFNSQGEPDMMLLQMYIIASDSAAGTAWPGTAAAIGTTAVEDEPYALSDAVITLGGATREVEEFVLGSYHQLKAKTANSLTLQGLRPRDRINRLKVRIPWNSTNDAMYNLAVAGAAGSIVFTNGACSTTITIGKFQAPADSPVIPGKDQISLIVDGQIRGNSTTSDLVIVNDHTV